MPDETKLRSDLQTIVRAYRALTYRGGIDADVEGQTDLAEEFGIPAQTSITEVRKYAYLTRKAGEKPFSTHAVATFPDINIGKIRRVQNQYWNAFKHARPRSGIERKDRELLERFGDEVNDHTLFIGWYDYMLAVRTLLIEAQIFQVWYFALYPEKLNPEVDTTTHQRLFPLLPTKSRADQKRALREVISSYQGNAEVMNHPKTDPRPLMLRAEALKDL